MQTDPNWTNFLWNPKTRQVCFVHPQKGIQCEISFQIELVDFGATRTYSKEFMDMWLSLLRSAAAGDREACIEWSLKLGYLTGGENQVSRRLRHLFTWTISN
jgi:aarF domain-containing kinase